MCVCITVENGPFLLFSKFISGPRGAEAVEAGEVQPDISLRAFCSHVCVVHTARRIPPPTRLPEYAPRGLDVDDCQRTNLLNRNWDKNDEETGHKINNQQSKDYTTAATRVLFRSSGRTYMIFFSSAIALVLSVSTLKVITVPSTENREKM